MSEKIYGIPVTTPFNPKKVVMEAGVGGNYVTPMQYGAACDGVTDDTDAINAMFAQVKDGSTILFPSDALFKTTKQLFITGKKNITIDFNHSTITPLNNFTGEAILAPAYVNKDSVLCVDYCENITIKNAIFDCDTWNNGLTWFIAASIHNSISNITDCIFKNADYHHIRIKNGVCNSENLIFENLGSTGGMSDVYTSCDDNNAVETHWYNIKSTREIRNTGQLFYFGVTSDTERNYHTVDGAESNNCGPVVDLRGGNGYFRNITGNRCGGVSSAITGTTTVTNMQHMAFENVNLEDVILDNSTTSPIFIQAGREIYLNNISVSLSAENTLNVVRFIDINARYNSLKNIHISNCVYRGGYNLWGGIAIHGEVDCLLENITIETEPSDNALYTNNAAGKIDIVNYKCPKKKVSIAGNSTANISMKNHYRNKGTTAERPIPFNCETVLYYDTDLQTQVRWDGSKWTEEVSKEYVDNAFDFVTPQMFGAIGDGVADDTAAINAMFSGVTNGKNVLFPEGVTYNLSKQMAILDKKNITINFNGCIFKPSSQYEGSTIFTANKCDNLALLNGYIDCNGKEFGVQFSNSDVSIDNYTFTNATRNHIFVKDSSVTGKSINLTNLAEQGSADICLSGSSKTQWCNIKVTREIRTNGNVITNDVQNDEVKQTHSFDGLEVDNCGPILNITGGNISLRNIIGNYCGGIIVDKAGSTTEANTANLMIKNMYLTNVMLRSNDTAPILVRAARKASINNVTMSLSAENTQTVARFIEIRAYYHALKDIHINNCVYKGDHTLWSGANIQGEVNCLLENITIENTPSGNAINLNNVTGKVEVVNYNCPKKNISGTANIAMRNYYRSKGTTAERPVPYPCETALYYDTDLAAFVLWNGSAWKTLTTA